MKEPTLEELMAKWDENLGKERSEKIDKLFRDEKLFFFFDFNGKIFGGPEESRLCFARIFRPDEDEKAWAKEADFGAADLERCINGEETTRIFTAKDIPQIKIIDRETAKKRLEN